MVRDHPCWRWNRIRKNLFRVRIRSKPLSSLLLLANTHKEAQQKGSRPRAKDALSFPSAILSVGLPKAQGKVKGAGKERSEHPLRAQRPPPQHWPGRGRLDWIQNGCGSSGFQTTTITTITTTGYLLQLPKSALRPHPTPQFSCSALERPTASPLHTSPVLSLRNYGPNSLPGLSPFPNLMVCLSAHSCH